MSSHRCRLLVAVAYAAALAWFPAPLRAQGDGPSLKAHEEPVLTPAATHEAQDGRRKVGLALGGGSARGFAHIGVLRWFEEHRIPVDVISGTSMGGLVAGAYASGMSPQEIQDLMKEVDWDLMFIADSPFKYKTFRRKQDKRAYPSQLEFGLKGGVTLFLAISLIASGLVRMWIGFTSKNLEGWGWVVAGGLITALAGLIIFSGWPVNSLWILGIFLAIDLIFQGITYIAFGFGLRRAR